MAYFIVSTYPFMALLSVILLSFLSLTSLDVTAQATVRNLQEPSDSTPQETINFAYEIQNMQAEIQALRGQLEQQAFEIKRLKQQRLDDYLDLDKRVSELTRQQIKDPSPVKPTTNTEVSSFTDNQQSNDKSNDNTAKLLYDEAIDLLLNKQDYGAASIQFDQYLTRYPNSELAPNAYYWQGQIALGASKKNEATELFKKLIDDYPEHPKTPDASFKLARIYFESGKTDAAKILLDRVAASDSDAALLARSFLTKHYRQ